ncbi:hypothetical protein C0580_04415 [Candidatus Parcubacteria bacterium]|nr:MAG: hypothetical protein C0580_04415 [Candidatus Parcubacteria bacterium]
MSRFRQKKISKGQTLSDKLRKARLEKELSIKDVETKTRIPTKYIEVLENGHYKELPGDIYAKAWIKLYAEILDLPPRELLEDFKIEKNISEKVSKLGAPKIKKNQKFSFGNIVWPKVLKFFSVTIVILALLGYLGWSVKNIISAPEVVIHQPSNNFRTTESSVEIVGQTKPEVQLTINGELVLLDEDGNFFQTVNLVNGLNNLEISAKKKHSKTNNIELIIFRESLEIN